MHLITSVHESEDTCAVSTFKFQNQYHVFQTLFEVPKKCVFLRVLAALN